MIPQTIQDTRLDLIDEPPQVREHFDPESLLGLAATMREKGVLQPITVRRVGERYSLLMGARRYRAARIAGLTGILARIVDRDLTEAEVLELQLLENCAREDLNPVDKARAFNKRMSLTGRTAA